MSLPLHEIVYSPRGDLLRVRMYLEVEGTMREMVYEKVEFPFSRKGATTYAITRKDPLTGRTSTGTTVTFEYLPLPVQKIFQAGERKDLEALLRSQQIKGFVVKP